MHLTSDAYLPQHLYDHLVPW